MKNRIKFLQWTLLLVFAAGLATSCTDEEPMGQFAFTSRLEGFVNTDTAGSSLPGAKVFLENEKWIYWEDGDIISIGSNTSSANNYMAQLANVNAGFINDPDGDWQQFNGLFLTNLPEGSKYFLGLHPYNSANLITPAGSGSSSFSAVEIVCPAEQPFTGNDLSFARNVIPMVAWYGGEWRPEQPSEPFNLDFHSLASIVRVQFYSEMGISTLNTIEVYSTDSGLPISGKFSVKGYNTSAPYLEAIAGQTSQTITIPCGGRTVSPGEVVSFYVVIPSLSRGTQQYNLRFTINGTSAAELNMKLRRCGIAFAPALSLTGSNLDGEVGLPGNGTEERPYKIYTFNDLRYIRDQFNVAAVGGDTPKINGVPVTANTVFHLMRNDIVLDIDWTGSNATLEGGIRNFIGKFVWKAYSGSSTPGITNISYSPLFESISEHGEVIDLPMAVQIDLAGAAATVAAFSPFCGVNNGTLRNCRVYDRATAPPPTEGDKKSGRKVQSAGLLDSDGNANMAGFCISNYGSILDCSCELTFETGSTHNVAGIVLNNHASVQSCAAATPMRIYNAQYGSGIAYENQGTIKDSYFTIRQTAGNTVAWSGIAHSNLGTIRHCYTSATAAIVSTGAIAGIVMNNEAGAVVDYCWFGGSIASNDCGAGIAHTNLGTVINCYVNGAQIVSPAVEGTVAAGLIAYHGDDGGSSSAVLANSYYYAPRILCQDASKTHHVGALIAFAYDGVVDNCYAYETGNPINPFANNIATSGTTFTNCYHVGHSDYGISGIDCSITSSTTGSMLGGLNANKDNFGTGIVWLAGTPPVLQTTQNHPTGTKQAFGGFGRFARR